jgi:uncharacterized Zn ribbon protein
MSKSEKICLLSEGDHTIDYQTEDFAAMQLKSEFVKKV